eukprot:c7972_g1_i2 orf=109-909(+)
MEEGALFLFTRSSQVVASVSFMQLTLLKPEATLGSAQRLSSILRHRHRSVIWKPRFGAQHPPPPLVLGRGRRHNNIGMTSMAMPLFGVDDQLLHDLAMGVVTLGGALGSLKFWEEFAMRNAFPKKVTRKLVHISIGLIFMLFWPLFSDSAAAPYIASFSAAVNGLRMIAIGLGIVQDAAVVKAMTREGDAKELLRGPLYYAMTITLATTCFWRTSPLAPIVIANLCAGDGFADLIGRKFGNTKLPYNLNKSYAGTTITSLALASIR